MHDLEEREKKALHLSLRHVDSDFKEAAEAAEGMWENPNSLEERFGIDSYGHHEIVDRAYLITENWQTYVLNHPSAALHKEAFRLAHIAEAFMWEFYQLMGCMDLNESKTDKEVREKEEWDIALQEERDDERRDALRHDTT